MKICIATGTRAEYGLLSPLIDELKLYKNVNIQLLITGSHLSPEFGLTFKQINLEGISKYQTVEMLLSSDTAEGITKSMGIGMIGFSEAFKNLKPDLLVILGDRYEMLSLASVALIFKIPIAHIHGGEITEGAYDDAIRHAITKLSHLHFASTDIYKNRIIQLGEQPETVFNVGAIGIDNIKRLQLLSKKELEENLKFNFCKWNYIVSFHPETLKKDSVESQFQKLLDALECLEDSFIIFTKSNADSGGRIINEMMSDYILKHSSKAVLFDSLGTLRYLSVIKNCTALIGNSSSGILEAPALNCPTINIGNRQKGRIYPKSVLNCQNESNEILNLLREVQDSDFISNLFDETNPYGNGEAAVKIAKIITEGDFSNLGIKIFHNI